MIIVIRNNEQPCISLDLSKNFVFRVIETSVKLVPKQNKIGILSINSNLIDISSRNSIASVITLPLDGKKSWYHSNSIVPFYKLSLKNFEYISFEFCDLFDQTTILVEQFYIKLEIKEANDRLQ